MVWGEQGEAGSHEFGFALVAPCLPPLSSLSVPVWILIKILIRILVGEHHEGPEGAAEVDQFPFELTAPK